MTASIRVWVVSAAIVVTASGARVNAQVLDAVASTCAEGALPPNVQVQEMLRPVVRVALARSPLFAGQCQRLARAPHVRITVTLNPRMSRTLYQAMTRIRRFTSGYIVADVELALTDDYSEPLAHEFEHVLEQLDGWALRRLVRVRGAGVFLTMSGGFETQRAIDAGRQAARERRASPRPVSPQGR